jgi:hypothetical protein
VRVLSSVVKYVTGLTKVQGTIEEKRGDERVRGDYSHFHIDRPEKKNTHIGGTEISTSDTSR